MGMYIYFSIDIYYYYYTPNSTVSCGFQQHISALQSFVTFVQSLSCIAFPNNKTHQN